MWGEGGTKSWHAMCTKNIKFAKAKSTLIVSCLASLLLSSQPAIDSIILMNYINHILEECLALKQQAEHAKSQFVSKGQRSKAATHFA